jgi:hypothetical protein
MSKAYKRLLELYLENFQFYEALNVVKLGDISNIRPDGWANAVEAFMLIIKGHYEEGVTILTHLCNELKRSEEDKLLHKAKHQRSHLKARYNDTSELRKGLALGSPGAKVKDCKDKQHRMRYFSTKSVAKAVPKIESTRVRTKVVVSSKKDELRVQTEYVDKDRPPELYRGR